METLVLIVALITLIVALCTLGLVSIILRESANITLPMLTNPFTKKTTNKGQDVYTPDYADTTSNLEDFEPDFSKPIKVKVGEGHDAKEFTTGEGEQLTPINTDDVMEEDEDQR